LYSPYPFKREKAETISSEVGNKKRVSTLSTSPEQLSKRKKQKEKNRKTSQIIPIY
jgi:hypothetical protein